MTKLKWRIWPIVRCWIRSKKKTNHWKLKKRSQMLHKKLNQLSKRLVYSKQWQTLEHKIFFLVKWHRTKKKISIWPWHDTQFTKANFCKTKSGEFGQKTRQCKKRKEERDYNKGRIRLMLPFSSNTQLIMFFLDRIYVSIRNVWWLTNRWARHSCIDLRETIGW